MNEKDYTKELNTIKQIAQENGYNTKRIDYTTKSRSRQHKTTTSKHSQTKHSAQKINKQRTTNGT